MGFRIGACGQGADRFGGAGQVCGGVDAVGFAQIVDGLVALTGIAAHHIVLPILDDRSQGLFDVGVVVVPCGIGQGVLEGVISSGGEIIQPCRVEFPCGLFVIG